ncbi:transcription factor HES-5-like [Micropterus salmoides]|uniref:transcription factor HES-5-like n=1 Tax=Micropterus salmoides TaxID=27706 RepID=UPI0018EB768F|nr:transcription factor HES-5-like [Micropterus salmoides]
MISVCSVKVIDPSIRQQICSLYRTVRNSSQTQTHTFIWRCWSIRRRDEASRDQILSTETSTAQRSNHGTYNHCSNDRFSGASDSDPQVRINSSIEKLKSLLGPEFLKQQPDSKLEKPDILEMTVCVLRRLQQQNQAVDSAAVDQGYSSCVQEVNHFLSKEEVETQSQRRLVNHFNKLQSSSDKTVREADISLLSSTVQTSIIKEKSLARSAPWRPW